MAQTAHSATPATKSFKEALITVAFVVILWCIPEIYQMFSNGIVITRLSPALSDGLAVAALPRATVIAYVVAFVLKYASLIAIAAFLTRAFASMLRGTLFSTTVTKSLRFASYGIVVWIIARLGIEGLANNHAASVLGVDSWWNTGSGTPLSDLSPAIILMATLIAFEAVLQRGKALEEEVDGLV
ncbi:hypothetical protein M3G47_06150 [Corynebacterium sanguinis]|uniref:DUF2975 domain-containing protein n=1 Tax=Corynebacterium sanguinis TaxID=2594913 RepID=A0A6C1TYB7_9CORY|nr:MULTISPECIES: hypothetical protein [Corynebacterium]MCT1426827.1 hypothetical protein [Corynebacterium sanguinis]MCT1464156.1 hypothetical protein [Corynebacterium sanguinis]MCT1491692.1 hypothetical protein [Corynebacterium sanguinis]MCT1555284.1 hypothetical protein [Corynebacterium sanguinis]MCT1614857.1 hypothetical protein [Corynebacterium sanguinis]